MKMSAIAFIVIAILFTVSFVSLSYSEQATQIYEAEKKINSLDYGKFDEILSDKTMTDRQKFELLKKSGLVKDKFIIPKEIADKAQVQTERNGDNLEKKESEKIHVSVPVSKADEQKQSESGEKNRAEILTEDNDTPAINLIAPANNSIETLSNFIAFVYNVTDATSSIQNCSLFVDNELKQTDFTVSENIEQSFEQFLVNGDYEWNITCTDGSNNHNFGVSATFNLEVSVIVYNAEVQSAVCFGRKNQFTVNDEI